MLFISSSFTGVAQLNSEKFKKASSKISRGYKNDNKDTLAQGYFDLAVSYFQKGEFSKSETHYQLAKNLFTKNNDADGIAKSSRGLARVQEQLNNKIAALSNYNTAEIKSLENKDPVAVQLNRNDIYRLTNPDTLTQESYLQQNIQIGIRSKDTLEVVANYEKLASVNLKKNLTPTAVSAFQKALTFSVNNPEQTLRLNQKITDAYVKDKDFVKAIETKELTLSDEFVSTSSVNKAGELIALAQIYIEKKEHVIAIQLLQQAYSIAVQNGHTLLAKESIEKMDTLYSASLSSKSLALYRNFLEVLPEMILKDSSLADNKLVAETEQRLKLLEAEKELKDVLIRKKNTLNYWLTGSLLVLTIFIAIILYTVKKLRIRNKKIALQSLRREMNPHFIFNSLNSINQFIANNNELAANQYLSKFSTLMRSVMENSKEDFVLFSKEADILQKYLELEKSRFPDKFDFNIKIDDQLYTEENLFIPGMLVQPHLENSIWHGLRYKAEKGLLLLHFTKQNDSVEILIEDNGIGIAESKKVKTSNQQQHHRRGITNTLERIKILNELYHQDITCTIEDKQKPDHGVKVVIKVPLLKNVKG